MSIEWLHVRVRGHPMSVCVGMTITRPLLRLVWQVMSAMAQQAEADASQMHAELDAVLSDAKLDHEVRRVHAHVKHARVTGATRCLLQL